MNMHPDSLTAEHRSWCIILLCHGQRRIYGFWCPGQDFQTVLPHLSDGPSDVMQIRVIFAPHFGAPSLGALGSCPSRLPLHPPLVMEEWDSKEVAGRFHCSTTGGTAITVISFHSR